MTDPDLVLALRSRRLRPADACARLYDAHGDEIYQACWSDLRDHDLAQAILRDTLIVARAHIDRLGDPARLREWLLALALSECARHRAGPSPGLDGPEGRRDDGGAPADAPGGRRGGGGFAADAPALGTVRPDCLRVRVLSGVAQVDRCGQRAYIATRAGSFDRAGFPVPQRRDADGPAVVRLLPGFVVLACTLLIAALACYVYLLAVADRGVGGTADAPGIVGAPEDTGTDGAPRDSDADTDTEGRGAAGDQGDAADAGAG
ncbi:RNA polymerase sigma factor [Nocardiopsis mangrovi]|uniref:RNA polymerase sigma factor n=1 Tax=Nocardiopsis mangrovi TaxID=1179818 RepID=A0ABV9DZH8_9ACTN